MTSSSPDKPEISGPSNGKLLCLTICGYRKSGMSEEDYRRHMTKVSAPMTQDLMVKYGIIRWTQIHNQASTRALMNQLYDSQMANIADFDCFSQVVFKSVGDYRKMKQDPWYKKHLVGDHEKFADTKRSMMTIGWISQFIDNGIIVDGITGSSKSSPKNPSSEISSTSLTTGFQATALITGSFLSGAMMSLSLMAIPVFLDTATQPAQLFHQWTRTYHYGHQVLPTMAVTTFALYIYTAVCQRTTKNTWILLALAGMATVGMLPFTWIFMVPTNDALFQLAAESKATPLVASWDEARHLVTYWSLLHFVRSLFPLVGAILGSVGTFHTPAS